MVECTTCGGIYEPISDDGIAYTHVCPPVRAVKVRRKDGTIVIVAPDAVLDTDQVIAELALARKGGRNENPNLEITRKDGSHPMLSVGAGVTVLDDAAPVLVGLPDAVQPGTDPAA